ncbi:MAG: hypothetical protein WAN14_08250 [Candidatus Acidiferrales bacterium]
MATGRGDNVATVSSNVNTWQNSGSTLYRDARIFKVTVSASAPSNHLGTWRKRTVLLNQASKAEISVVARININYNDA